MIIGTFLLIILTSIFIRTAGSLSGWVDYLIASLIVGFIVGADIYKGMFNGVITSLIGGLIVFIMEILMLEGNFDIIALIVILIYSLFVMVVMGIIGGLTGSFIKKLLNSLINLPDESKRNLKDSSHEKLPKSSINLPDKQERNLKGFSLKKPKLSINLPDKQERRLKCKTCEGEYILEQDELPGDFLSCSCGGELEFYDVYGRKRPYTTSYPKEKKEMPLGTKILILTVVVIFSLYYIGPFLMFSIIDYVDPSVVVYIFPIFFAICIAAVLIMIWYAFIRK